jgi:uncharacterized protein
MSEMNKRAECAIAIMAKAPLPGEVKTRLCPQLSYEDAAQLYRCFLLDKIEQLNSLKATVPAVAYTPDDTEPLFEAMVPSSFTLECAPPTGEFSLRIEGRAIEGLCLFNRHLVFPRG